ncbi:putative Zein-binding domain-containing protein [Rosa chinensis]|uniref:Putative Zein-binding domain-containing protein n=1 Tax=Rosa chinensis TaxID=74649 RepID=A0A2P6PQM2_ROSCH|nr:protein FLOURY 1-like [Rosa chinensis]PRQ24224.1 putative Zein-binding domain-containing protein [Rosa chinensis]
MQSLVQFYLFLICFSAALEFVQNFLGFFGMDFVFGVLLYGRFSPLFVSGLSLMFGFGLLYHYNYLIKFLCDNRAKASDFSNGFCSKCGSHEVCASKAVSCKSEPLKSLENLQSTNADGFLLTKIVKAKDAIEGKDDDDGDNDDENVCCKEDEVFDVLSLRQLVKIERRRGNEARAELEKERMAAASAAEEAMAMILRLQNEKSSTEIQASHYRQIAEQKQQYDEAVIQSLQWIIMKHESERSQLEEQLRLCRQMCNGQSVEGDPSKNLFDSTNMEDDGLEDVFGAHCRYFEYE